jgi:hypothetical protein
MTNLHLRDVFLIGENDAYIFGVGRVGDRWIGFATDGSYARRVRDAFGAEGLPADASMLFVFPQIAEGYQMGILDRECCVLLTGAIAEDPE